MNALDVDDQLTKLEHEYPNFEFVVVDDEIRAINSGEKVSTQIPIIADYTLQGVRRLDNILAGR